MARHRLNIKTESRIRWKVYVRFGGEYLETGHDYMTRRRVLSLHYHHRVIDHSADDEYECKQCEHIECKPYRVNEGKCAGE